MSLYADYLRETGLREIVETPASFIAYNIQGQECWIEDAYTAPTHRRTGETLRILNEVREIARSRGCKYLTCSVNPASKNPTLSMSAQLKHGFKILKSTDKLIYMVQDLYAGS